MVSQESVSPQEAIVDDLLAVEHTFSCGLCWLCRFAKALSTELAGDAR